MSLTIQQLLKQKTWTGDEVGKAIILSAVHSYRQLLSGVEAPTELFSAEQLKRMVDSLTDREQLRHYNRYVGLNNWLTQFQAVANAYLQVLDGKSTAIASTLNTSAAVEEGYRHTQRLPAIMTPKQYDALRADPQALAKNCRACRNGIAILLVPPTQGAPLRLDDDGYYQEPDGVSYLSSVCGLEQFTARNPNCAEHTEILQKARRDLDIAIHYIIGYDKAIELIAEHIELPEFLVFSVHSEASIHRIGLLNRQIDLLRTMIAEATSLDLEGRALKLQVLSDLFEPLPCDGLSVPKPAVEAARTLLQDNMRAFEKQDGLFIRLLTEWR